MERTIHRTLLVCGFALATLGFCGRSSDAQPRGAPERIHAAACVGELGWRAPAEACASIVEVHMRIGTARDLRPELVAQAFSAALRRPPPRRQWVPELAQASPRRAPRSWPARLPWGRYAARVEEYAQVAQEVLEGHFPEACPGCINYGGLMDAQPPGTVEVRRFVLSERPLRAQVFYRRATPDDT